jgi:hypothetical protein
MSPIISFRPLNKIAGLHSQSVSNNLGSSIENKDIKDNNGLIKDNFVDHERGQDLFQTL